VSGMGEVRVCMCGVWVVLLCCEGGGVSGGGYVVVWLLWERRFYGGVFVCECVRRVEGGVECGEDGV